jgi:NAD(P)-dependent dehydrogenase (short-subunit alcohol dehydrogenase family)
MRTHATQSDRNVLITGAARRIGREIAIGLAKEGFNVAIHCNQSTSEANELKKTIEETGVSATVISANLSDADSAKKIFNAANRQIGPISYLINNASLFSYDSPASASWQDLDAHMRVNLFAPILLTQAFADQLSDQSEGCVINLLDQKTHNLNPDFFSYTLSKVALESATKMLASTLGPKIRVCGLAPGITLPSGEQTDAGFEKAHKLSPLGRSSSTEDLVEAAKYLLAARSITGTTLIVDGGQHLWPTHRDVQFEVNTN